jgi:hypothetical protein
LDKRKMGFFYEQVKTEVFGHHVAAMAQTEWGKGGSLKLYVDGKLVDSATGVLFGSKKVPLLRSSIDHDGKLHEIEVYLRGRRHLFGINLGRVLINRPALSAFGQSGH